jgi:hypothetical protein
MNGELIVWSIPLHGVGTDGWQCFCRDEGQPCCNNPWQIYAICADVEE